jgi:hypothetical protein
MRSRHSARTALSFLTNELCVAGPGQGVMADEPNSTQPARVIVLVLVILALAWTVWSALS